jgi:hypothetical protein
LRITGTARPKVWNSQVSNGAKLKRYRSISMDEGLDNT